MAQAATDNGQRWTFEADVVIVGSGAAGLPAAIKAVEGGASVIVVETNYDIGGHAIISGGHMALGGGTSAQKKYGIPDSPDTVFSDLTDWSIIQPNGWPDFRYNDRAVMRAFADHCALTYEFLLATGVEFTDKAPDNHVASSTGTIRSRSCILDQGRGVGKSKRLGGNGRNQAARGKRACQGRTLFAQL
jgi:succinate dehydrogenase/fumarate reductase flavoprotein subunit